MGKNRSFRAQSLKRKTNIRDSRPTYLIVCEGEKTEPIYFRNFRGTSAKVEIEGKGKSPKKIVEFAYKKKKDYDHTWCVFDRNSWPEQEFNEALSLAKKKGIKIAYSIPKFELWYLLHFNYIDTAITPDDYDKKLESILGVYKKNDPKMYEKLCGKQDDAIRHAEKLLEKYISADSHQNDPSTTVHRLVKELNRHINVR